MTTDPSAVSRPARAGAVAAIVMTAFGAVFTLLAFVVAIWFAASFAADGELYGSAWAAVAGLATYAVISALATVYIGRRGLRELRRTSRR